jgi:hypothetical protein
MKLDIPPELVPHVVRALENHAAYLKGYKDENTTARKLQELADTMKKS